MSLGGVGYIELIKGFFGLTYPIKESEWISHMVVQDRNIDEVHIYIDLRKLNDSCMYDPFPTLFTDEVLQEASSQEMYSFTDGFLRYHQIQIGKEVHHKTTFVTEWGCFQYTVMPFGLKNALVIFSWLVVAAFKYFIHMLSRPISML